MTDDRVPSYEVRVLTPGPCRAHFPPGSRVGEACPHCGHTNLVHPGSHNPALNVCLLCRLVDIVDRTERGTTPAPYDVELLPIEVDE